MDEIMTFISTVGFPIVMCLLLFWYIRDTNDKMSEEIRTMKDAYKEEIMKMTIALNNNTTMIEKLIDRLGDA